jgi:hypothetical protein
MIHWQELHPMDEKGTVFVRRHPFHQTELAAAVEAAWSPSALLLSFQRGALIVLAWLALLCECCSGSSKSNPFSC